MQHRLTVGQPEEVALVQGGRSRRKTALFPEQYGDDRHKGRGIDRIPAKIAKLHRGKPGRKGTMFH
jgi:hypothetical protein